MDSSSKHKWNTELPFSVLQDSTRQREACDLPSAQGRRLLEGTLPPPLSSLLGNRQPPAMSPTDLFLLKWTSTPPASGWPCRRHLLLFSHTPHRTETQGVQIYFTLCKQADAVYLHKKCFYLLGKLPGVPPQEERWGTQLISECPWTNRRWPPPL